MFTTLADLIYLQMSKDKPIRILLDVFFLTRGTCFDHLNMFQHAAQNLRNGILKSANQGDLTESEQHPATVALTAPMRQHMCLTLTGPQQAVRGRPCLYQCQLSFRFLLPAGFTSSSVLDTSSYLQATLTLKTWNV